MIVNLKCTGCDLNVQNLIANGWFQKFPWKVLPYSFKHGRNRTHSEVRKKMDAIQPRDRILFIVGHEQNFVEEQTSDTIGHGVTDKLEIKQISGPYSGLIPNL